MSLRVARIGAGATLQDHGRFGYRHFGVPWSGPFDTRSALLANSLLGNHEGATVLELPAAPFDFEALEPTAYAMFGAACKIRTIRAQPHRYGDQHCLLPGDRICADEFGEGCRIYLALPGGIASEKVLGSSSGQTVKEGDVLRAALPGTPTIRAALERFSFKHEKTLYARPGVYYADACGEKQQFELIVDHRIDRRGVRLKGANITHDLRLTSEPMAVGSIQWTPSGEWIVIGPDGPTLGGYPKVGYLLGKSVSDCGQLRPGERVKLSFVTEEEAIKIARAELEERVAIRRLSQIVLAY